MLDMILSTILNGKHSQHSKATRYNTIYKFIMNTTMQTIILRVQPLGAGGLGAGGRGSGGGRERGQDYLNLFMDPLILDSAFNKGVGLTCPHCK